MGERYQQVKTHLPHISINSWSDYMSIARPYEKYELEERNGFWEIKVTQTSVWMMKFFNFDVQLWSEKMHGH